MLKLIQLGLTFTDAEGNLPICNGEHTVWQFNFRGFRLSEDVYAQDSIELLKQSGIDFAQNEVRSSVCSTICSSSSICSSRVREMGVVRLDSACLGEARVAGFGKQ